MRTDGSDRGPTFLTLGGIPSHRPPPEGAMAYVRDLEGGWRSTAGDLLPEIDDTCARIHDALARRLFPDIEVLYHHMRIINPEMYRAGLNSESTMSVRDFEAMLKRDPDYPDLYRLLYLFDCQKQVASIQECCKEATYLVGEFYRILNLEPLFPADVPMPDGMRFLTSPTVTRLTCTLAMVYVRLHSLLDYITKLAVEVERMKQDFTTYPTLASAKKLYGSKQMLPWDKQPGTLMERCDVIQEIELVRNLIIHDGLLDDMPKAYIQVQGGDVVEKFVLMPDRDGARWARYKNRRLFYGSEDRVNLRLPALLEEFQQRQLQTLAVVLRRLGELTTAELPKRQQTFM